MNTGSVFGGRPSLGAWAQYGLGTSNQNLPGFVVIKDSEATVVNGARNWGNGFMPAVYQGVEFSSEGTPIKFLDNPKGVDRGRQREKLDLLGALNRDYNAPRASNTELDARIKGYELAFQMQAEAPDAVDLSKETEATKKLYGMDNEATAVFGRNCLLARRLVENGVRFIQLYSGAGSKWDAHKGIEVNHGKYCNSVDKPIAGLLSDLKARGLLDETLVIWGGEFGRTVYSQGGLFKENYGRDHHPRCFTMWMAGGGARPGQIYGETDDFSYNIVKNPVHIRDFHATVLHLMGFDHERFTYRHLGLDQKLTGVEHAKVIADLLA
jgi:arylsulfatase A-like enzyme